MKREKIIERLEREGIVSRFETELVQIKKLKFFYKNGYEPPCWKCVHFDLDAWLEKDVKRCDAFEDIPEEIWQGKNDHKEAYPGDNGIQYLSWYDYSRLKTGHNKD
ncbi:hypothetical protein JZK55_17110 [Dissulfurispira thermophila]|uniref:Uncharacterized protein n=2 Tax=root TaxID=1 RepID=A0A7G1H3N6_9BACT|nr:hypothetical protein [Dissulfurispira thermophila]BCB96789.1 hypothetical protein JZK55_17110 [Dissulfurispira thermophila]